MTSQKNTTEIREDNPLEWIPRADFSTRLKEGELYCFHLHNKQIWWGICAKIGLEEIRLESATTDWHQFSTHLRLPQAVTAGRLASRAELRDFTYNRALAEIAELIRHILSL